LVQLGVSPITTYKREALLKCFEASNRDDKVTFPVKHLGRLQKEITSAIQKVYGPQTRLTYKNYLNLGSPSKKSVSLNKLRKVFNLFPDALALLPNIDKIIKDDLEPEIIKNIIHTGKHEDMYDIEVGNDHTYQVEGVICHNSTTLYAALLSIYQRDTRRSFATIEDPVEYRLPFRATQSPVDESKNVTYEKLIRQAMRNDGDTFLIGEIRDGPTANASLQLALTGHQVLSSIHANSAPETALRLLEFGVDPYILSETLKMVVAQRLVPTCCPYCKKQIPASEVPALLRKYGGEILLESWGPLWERKYRKEGNWIRGEGCAQCQFTGLSGVTAAQEFLVIDHKNRKFLKEGNIEKLEDSMKEKSLLKMEEVVWKFAWQGRIPIEQAGELTNQLKSG
jgi:type IV secretory pathway ATPase VirB11/archaellum biosynthesis ATPase